MSRIKTTWTTALQEQLQKAKESKQLLNYHKQKQKILVKLKHNRDTKKENAIQKGNRHLLTPSNPNFPLLDPSDSIINDILYQINPSVYRKRKRVLDKQPRTFVPRHYWVAKDIVWWWFNPLLYSVYSNHWLYQPMRIVRQVNENFKRWSNVSKIWWFQFIKDPRISAQHLTQRERTVLNDERFSPSNYYHLETVDWLKDIVANATFMSSINNYIAEFEELIETVLSLTKTKIKVKTSIQIRDVTDEQEIQNILSIMRSNPDHHSSYEIDISFIAAGTSYYYTYPWLDKAMNVLDDEKTISLKTKSSRNIKSKVGRPKWSRNIDKMSWPHDELFKFYERNSQKQIEPNQWESFDDYSERILESYHISKYNNYPIQRLQDAIKKIKEKYSTTAHDE